MPKQFTAKRDIQQGRWSNEEHYKMLDLITKYGFNWKKIAQGIGSRKCTQVRSHYQKYIDIKQKKDKIKSQKQFSTIGVQAVDSEIDFELENLQYGYKQSQFRQINQYESQLYLWQDTFSQEKEYELSQDNQESMPLQDNTNNMHLYQEPQWNSYLEKEIKLYEKSSFLENDENFNFTAFDL